MEVNEHWSVDASFDGGDLDCGSGLLLLIRRHIDPLPAGGVLRLHSTDATVETDLPAWCRLTGNELLGLQRTGERRTYWISKGPRKSAADSNRPPPTTSATANQSHASTLTSVSAALSGSKESSVSPRIAPPPTVASPTVTPPIMPLSITGIGSWPRPRWLLTAIHERLSGRMDERAFHETADDAVRLCVAAQARAGVDIVTDGEQRRDSYASFVGALLDNCQLVPITDLLAYVDDPEEFARELKALDVPAEEVRHPAVFGPLRRSRPLAVDEFRFVRRIDPRPVKIALPGPYLLTRTMWLECVTDRAYATRESLAADIVRVLREELLELLAAGVSIVQFDEPVLSEVAFGAATHRRSFMCGALSERRAVGEELELARSLLSAVLEGVPRERTALHVCRGNWSRDESLALTGGYEPLADTLRAIPVGTYFLEMCTPRAGEWDVLRRLPDEARIGVGMLNPKSDRVESVEELSAAITRAIGLFGRDRVLLNPDCGFATFADNPVNSAD
ncbi:MAG TPA: hypothetical protein PLV92_16255, partial [Pirellulaceae bacterium]|nr:hypothetical protein [Pirellulaceae bacterium]